MIVPLADTCADEQLFKPLSAVKGIGPKSAAKLSKLGLLCLSDLLFHLPYKYQDRTSIVPIGALEPGAFYQIEGVVEHTAIVRRKRQSLVCSLNDGSGFLSLRFLNFYPGWKNNLPRGARLRCFGMVRRGIDGLEMVHPEYRRVSENEPLAQTLTPVYPATAGIVQKLIRRLAEEAIGVAQRAGLAQLLSADALHNTHFPQLIEALDYVHRPPPDADLAALLAGCHPAQRRLAFEELIAHTVSLKRLRAQVQRRSAALIDSGTELQTRFYAALPFDLTAGQRRIIDEIRNDLKAGVPMMRLVQGDVGSGKTVIAADAMLAAVAAGRQAALVAPTELLVEQHFKTLENWFEPLGVQVAFLTSRIKGKARKNALATIGDTADIVLGTHALMQKTVRFRDLSLVIVDEQHRFGVHQRLQLRDKGADESMTPHQLVMTATPIPRTLAMTVYADLDVSILDELPPGRTPVQTVGLSDQRRNDVIARIDKACGAGRQAYWVCPLVEESEILEAEAATKTAQTLAQRLPSVRIGLVHGRMKAMDKEQVMRQFQTQKLDLLVATTVIEVGVDVPNASLMIIDNAERLGLAQLHQLRGRVGRGREKSTCVLLYKAPLSANAKARIRVLRETNDGFKIAETDLKLRGPGEFLGTRQTGELQYRVADFRRDHDLIPAVQQCAQDIVEHHPDKIEPLIVRWLGAGVRYREV